MRDIASNMKGNAPVAEIICPVAFLTVRIDMGNYIKNVVEKLLANRAKSMFNCLRLPLLAKREEHVH